MDESQKRYHTGYVSGTFDLFHVGHLNLLRRAKACCDHLIVGVLADECVMDSKHRMPVIPLEDRMEIVRACRYADEVDVTTRELINKVTAWNKYHFDAMFTGDDHKNDGWAWEEPMLKELGAELVFFPYTQKVSTSGLRNRMISEPVREHTCKAGERTETATTESGTEVEIRQLDFDVLSKSLEQHECREVIIYGAGKNAAKISDVLERMGITVLYYVDKKARRDGEADIYRNKPVRTPEFFCKNYHGETTVISPKIYEEILSMLKQEGIPETKLIVPYIIRANAVIHLPFSYNPCLDSIPYCKKKPECPVVTVCTVAYNTPEILFRHAIESVLRQTFRDFTYVIIVNGATDNTREIANEYARKDDRIRVIELENNLLWTDQTLIKLVKNNIYGDYWCMLDSDDYFADDYLRLSLEESKISQADIVCAHSLNYHLPAADQRHLKHNDQLGVGLCCPRADNSLHGQQEILEAYARGGISTTMWGKLYMADMVRSCLEDALMLSPETCHTLFRLDIAVLFQLLTRSKRVVFLDRILHFVAKRQGNSSDTEAPPEWLMSWWYAYRELMKRFRIWYNQEEAEQYGKMFIVSHWNYYASRSRMLEAVDRSPNRDRIRMELGEMARDSLLRRVILEDMIDEQASRFYSEIVRMTEDKTGE